MKKISQINEDITDIYYRLKKGNVRAEDRNVVIDWIKDSNFEEIDLGLPSGNIWLNVNVGVTSGDLSEEGYYFSGQDIEEFSKRLPRGYDIPDTADWRELNDFCESSQIPNTHKGKNKSNWLFKFENTKLGKNVIIPKTGYINSYELKNNPDFNKVTKPTKNEEGLYSMKPVIHPLYSDKVLVSRYMQLFCDRGYITCRNCFGLDLNKVTDKFTLRLIKRKK